MKNGFKMIMLVAAIALQPAISFAQKKKITLDGKVFDVQLKDDAKKDVDKKDAKDDKKGDDK